MQYDVRIEGDGRGKGVVIVEGSTLGDAIAALLVSPAVVVTVRLVEVVRVPDVAHPHGLCYVASPEMARCSFDANHPGRHSWDLRRELPRRPPT